MPPKKKSAKKGSTEPKASVGRPRKNLGTRVSDLPLVSIVKPTTRRINVDSLAMNRARMAYKRDYGKVLDERTARALIDAMSTTKRGPIGTSVVGTFKGQDVKFDLPGGLTMKESSGFFNYYKLAKAAIEKNPKQKVKVKVKGDGSYTFTTPGIPEVTTGTLSATSVPKSSSKEIAIQTQMYTVKEQLQAKIAALRNALDSGTLDDGATALALAKIEEHKANIVKIQESLVDMPPKLSPMDDASTLALERSRQRDVVLDPDSTAAQRKAAQARVTALDRRINSSAISTGTQASSSSSIPVSEADITAAVLGEPEEERPLVRPTRRVRNTDADAGPSAPLLRPAAPATEEAAAELSAALANPQVAAIVEQVQENAPAKRAPSALAKANFQKMAKEREIKKAREAVSARLARSRADAEKLDNEQGRPKEQIAAERLDSDVRQREAIAQSAQDDGARILAQSAEERGRQLRVAAPTIQSLVRGRQTRKQLKKEADERNAMLEQAVQEEAAARGLSETEAARVMERERQEQELRDQEEQVRAEYERSQGNAATKIQSLVRGRQGRKTARLAEYVADIERRAAADRLAEYERDENERRAAAERLAEYERAENERRSQREAATKIQSLVRGRKGREVARLAEYDRADDERRAADERLAEYERDENERRSQREAATKIQSLVRGRKGREVARLAEYDRADDERRSAAERLAEYERAENERRSQREAATKIQSLVRGRKGREVARLAEYDRDENERRAAADRLAEYDRVENERRYQREQEEQKRAPADEAFDALVQGDAASKIQRAVRARNDRKAADRLAEYDRAENERRYQREQEEQARAPANEAFDALVQGDAASKIQRALRARNARRAESRIVVPGADIRPNDRVIPDTDRMARALQESGYTQMKRAYESIPTKPDGSLIGFPRDVPRAYDTARLPITFQRAGEDYIPVDAVFESERLPAFRDLAALDDTAETGSGLIGGRRGRSSFTGGVLRRLHGMGYFDGFDSLMYNIHGTPDDNKKDLADAKAAYAARGGAMGGSIVLSGVPAPTGGAMCGSGADADQYKLHFVAFPDDKWTTSSSLRWIRSNGIVPIKKAMHIPEYYKYQILPPSDNKDYMTHELVSRGRKILLGYARPS